MFCFLQHTHIETEKHFNEDNAKLSEEVKRLAGDIQRQHMKYEGFIAKAELTTLQVTFAVSDAAGV